MEKDIFSDKPYPRQEEGKGSAKLVCYDWMQGIKPPHSGKQLVEVRFKNTRKDFFVNNQGLPIKIGDIVAVEASSGHDVGTVSLTGELVKTQLRKVYGRRIPESFAKIYRKAKPSDIEKWKEAKALEHDTMIRARQIAKDMKLNMKIGDVEYQGDKTKAIFYYIADERVDFRELIKIFAEEFKVRIEMKQIGVRQEAGRIGGIGLCGRDLCCSTFISNFISVSTNAARYQEVSLNPQKLAGQCGKLKCCLNFELACYMDARKDFPDTNIDLEFKEGRARHTKTDVYKRVMTYLYKKDDLPTFVDLSVERVKEIIEMNKKGIKPEKLEGSVEIVETEYVPDYENVVGQESLTRFDKKKKKKKSGSRPAHRSKEQNPKPANGGGNGNAQPAQAAGSKPAKGNSHHQRHGGKHHNNKKPNNDANKNA